MAKTLLRDLFYAIVVMVLIIGGVTTTIGMIRQGSLGDAETSIANFGNDDELVAFNRTFNIIDDTTKKTDQLSGNLSKLTVEKSNNPLSVGSALISSAWNVVLIFIDSVDLLNSVIDGLAGHFSIPPWIPKLIIGLIVVVFVVSIISIIFGKEI